MTDIGVWQCSECGTLIESPNTRQCPTCGGINFYPLADEIPGGEDGTIATDVDVQEALKNLTAEDT